MTNGQTGEKPEWYDVLKAAVYFHISPDEAITMPVFWIEAAAIALNAENNVREHRRKLEESKQRDKGGGGMGRFFGRKRRR